MSEIVIEPPLRVASADSVDWAEQADILVVGFGAAGASAAIEARGKKRDVLVVDRFEGGGATRWAGGIVYAGCTRYQRDAGASDSTDEMFKYLSMEVEDAVTPETLRRFCETSNDNVEWLVANGIVFEGSLFKDKTTFPPEDKYLYYSGNEKVPAFAAMAKPAPRGHRVKGKGWTGYVLSARLKAAAVASGVRHMPHARAMRLVQDDSGQVVGVEVLRIHSDHRAAHQALFDKMDPMRPFGAKRSERLVAAARALEAQHGDRLLIRARDGVILACGGFAYNLEMVRRHMPAMAETFHTLIRMSSLSCDGSGIQLAQSVGAASKLTTPFLGRLLAPPNACIDGIVVNQQGERFINEDAYNGFLGRAIAAQPEGKGWLIVDNATHRKIIRQAVEQGQGTFKNFGLPTLLNLLFGGTRKAATLAGLERKCSFPAGSLERTVNALNTAKDAGQPDPGGKAADNYVRFGAGPYRALNTSVTNVFSFMPFFTLGGLLLDQASGGVLGENGRPIEGLYAAGRTAVGVCSDGYISGLSLADCVFSGRRAGAHAATRSLVSA